MPAIAHRLALSERLRRRRFELLPLDAAMAAPVSEPQGRDPGTATAPAELAELISSIASVGVLQPLLVEHVDGRHRLVAGERRLRALRWGHVNVPGHPNFMTAPAVVCPGPLTEEERRVWQLVENLARQDLQPGELAAALLYERCAVLAARLEAEGYPVAARVWSIEDPVRRWAELDRHRRDVGAHQLGAPWDEVLSRIGLQLSIDKAKAVVRAFRTLPREMSWEMDAAGVALASRLEVLRLERGRGDAAAAIWAAVRDRRQPRLLSGAVHAALDDPALDADDAVDAALAAQESANEARATALRNQISDGTADASEGDDTAGRVVTGSVAVDVVEDCVETLGALLGELRRGRVVDGYVAGTLQLQARELLSLLGERR